MNKYFKDINQSIYTYFYIKHIYLNTISYKIDLLNNEQKKNVKLPRKKF